MQILKGEIPLAQVYAVVCVLIAVSLLHFVSELIKSKGKINIMKLIVEAIATSFIIFIFYMGVYMFIFKVLNFFINDSRILSDVNLLWYTLISFICFISLFSIFFLYQKLNTLGRGVIVVFHILITYSIITFVNQNWVPQIELPILTIICTLILNLVSSIFFITYGTETNQKVSDAP
ncbi:hypothetical protein [Oceanobacillus sp. J11TS1]|uniref:hypothetical protein n=1 Tax=Oceanobacillus sp. J11TS1 TaxID=2807191 RepID=UPI001BB45028|nr:hypothetical protein [Oceanobacillus sp. J11TS1]